MTLMQVSGMSCMPKLYKLTLFTIKYGILKHTDLGSDLSVYMYRQN